MACCACFLAFVTRNKANAYIVPRISTAPLKPHHGAPRATWATAEESSVVRRWGWGDRLQAFAGAVALSVEGFEGDRLERQQNPPSLALALALVGAGVG